MKLSPPKKTTFWVAVVVAILGVLGAVVKLPVLSEYSLWVVVLGFVILALGNLLEGF